MPRNAGRPGGPPVPLGESGSDGSDVRRIFGFAGVFGMLLTYLLIMRPPARHATAMPDEAAAVASPATAAVASPARPLGGVLEEAKDGTEVAEDDPYRMLMLHVKRLTVDEIDTRAEFVPMHELVAHPEKYRGAFVRLRGVLVAPMGMRRLDKNPAQLEYAYRGYLVDTANDDAYCFDLIERPPEIEPRNEGAEVIGVFLKVASYETKFRTSDGKTSRQVPFIIAKRIVPITGTEKPWSGLTTLMIATLVFASLPLVGMWLAGIVKRRRGGELVDIVNRARERRAPLPSKKKEASPFPGAAVSVLGEGVGKPAVPAAPAEPAPPAAAAEPPPAPPSDAPPAAPAP